MRNALCYLLLLTTIACSTTAAVRKDEVVVVADADNVRGVAKGSPVPDDGVWLSMAYNSQMVKNLTTCQAEAIGCQQQLASIDNTVPWVPILIISGAALVVGATAGILTMSLTR